MEERRAKGKPPWEERSLGTPEARFFTSVLKPRGVWCPGREIGEGEMLP